MAQPAETVELAFGSVWSDDPAGFAWTDVTDYVRTRDGLEIRRGRSTELETFSAGQASFLLDSPARRFDPLNAAGPHFGDLVPGVPVRITAEGEPQFYGYVDAWRHLPGTQLGTVAVTATDAFRLLAGLTLRSAYEYVVLDDAPAAYWRLDGARGDIAADVSGNRRDGTFVGPVRRGVDVRLEGSGAYFPPGWNHAYVLVTDPAAFPTIEPLTVEAWITFGDAANADDFIMLAVVSGAPNYWRLTPWRFADVDYLEFSVNLGVATGQYLAEIDVRDGEPHHVVAVAYPTTGEVRMYLDGASVGAYNGPAVSLADPAQLLAIGCYVTQQHPTIAGSEGISVSDFAVYADTLSAERVLEHYDAAAGAWDGMRTGEIVALIADLIGWPSALRDIDTGDVICGPVETAGATALEILQALELTEGGRLFVAADGRLTFHAASRTFTGTPAYTFTDTGADAGILVGGLTFSLDDTFVFDAAEVQTVNGSPQRAGPDSATRVFTASGLLTATDSSARARAERVVARRSVARTRAEEFTVSLNQHNVAEWADILGLELGTVVAVAVTPQDSGAPVELELFVEQIAVRSTGGAWRMTFYGSPVDDRALFRFAGPTTVGSVNGFSAGVFR